MRPKTPKERRQKAAMALALNRTQAVAARCAGVVRHAVEMWLAHDEEFKAMVKAAEEVVEEEFLRASRAAALESVNVLSKIVRAPTSNDTVKAAQALLHNKHKLGEAESTKERTKLIAELGRVARELEGIDSDSDRE